MGKPQRKNLVIYKFTNWYPGMMHLGKPIRTRYYVFWEWLHGLTYQPAGFVVSPKPVREFAARSKKVLKCYVKPVYLEPQKLLEYHPIKRPRFRQNKKIARRRKKLQLSLDNSIFLN